MYLGHALLAFALAALAARLVGVDQRRSVLYGAAAAGFGLVPDVDLVSAVAVGRLAGLEGFSLPTGGAGSWLVHQSLTHSLLTGAVGAVFAGHVAALVMIRPSRGRRLPPPTALAAVPGLVGMAGGLVWVAWVAAGAPGVVTMLLYVGAVTVVAWLAVRRGATALGVAGAAAVGLLFHPLGDVFAARPPAPLYPLAAEPTLPALALSTEPTVNLVGQLLLELGLGWLALWLAIRPAGPSPWRLVRRPAALGLGGAATPPVVPPPTPGAAAPFTLGVLAAGVAVGVMTFVIDRQRRRARPGTAALTTALTAVTLAAGSYLAAYLALG